MKATASFLLFILTLLVNACASTETASESSVLSPVDPAATPVAPSRPANWEALQSVLSSLQIEGIGLEYESENEIDRLRQIFSDSRVTRRRIRTVYTGQLMDYDRETAAVTIASDATTQAAIDYILKHVPLK